MRAIKDFSEKKEKFLVEMRVLKEMIKMYVSKKIDWSQYESENGLAKNIIGEPITDPAIFENQPSLQEQLQNFTFKKVNQNTEETKSIISNNDSSPLIQELKKTLSATKLKPVDHSIPSNENKNNQSELEIKFAERQARLEEENNKDTNVSSTEGGVSKKVAEPLPKVSNFNEVNLSETEKYINFRLTNLKSFLSPEKFSELEFKLIEEETSRLSIIPEVNENNTNSMVLTDEKQTRPNSIMNKLGELSQFIQEEISSLDNEIKKLPAPLSMYFTSSDEGKPVIVDAILKPKI